MITVIQSGEFLSVLSEHVLAQDKLRLCPQGASALGAPYFTPSGGVNPPCGKILPLRFKILGRGTRRAPLSRAPGKNVPSYSTFLPRINSVFVPRAPAPWGPRILLPRAE